MSGRGAGIGGLGAPELDDGYGLVGAERERLGVLLAPPLHESAPASDMNEVPHALGVETSPGTFVLPSAVDTPWYEDPEDLVLGPPLGSSDSMVEVGPSGAGVLGSAPVSPALAKRWTTVATETSPRPSRRRAVPMSKQGGLHVPELGLSSSLAAIRSADSAVGQVSSRHLSPVPATTTAEGGPSVSGIGRAVDGRPREIARSLSLPRISSSGFPSVRRPVRPAVSPKPGRGGGGGVDGAIALREKSDAAFEFAHTTVLSDSSLSVETRQLAHEQGMEEAERLNREYAAAKEAARRNFSSEDQFNRRWKEAEDRRKAAAASEKTRNERQPSRPFLKAAGKAAADAREARDRANKVKADATRSQGDPGKVKAARQAAKAAKAAAKEAKKAARVAKNAAKNGTRKQREDAQKDAEAKAARARALALEAEKRMKDADREDDPVGGSKAGGAPPVPPPVAPPPPEGTGPEMIYGGPGTPPAAPDPIAGCGDAKGCGECDPPCSGDEECVCHWELEVPDGKGGGAEEDGQKGKAPKETPPTLNPQDSRTPGEPGATDPDDLGGTGGGKRKSDGDPDSTKTPDGSAPPPQKGKAPKSHVGRAAKGATNTIARHRRRLERKSESIERRLKPLRAKLDQGETLSSSEADALARYLEQRTANAVAISMLDDAATQALVIARVAEGAHGRIRRRAVEALGQLAVMAAGAERGAEKIVSDYRKALTTALLDQHRKFREEFTWAPEAFRRRLLENVHSTDVPEARVLASQWRALKVRQQALMAQLTLTSSEFEVGDELASVAARMRDLRAAFEGLGLPMDGDSPFGIEHKVFTDLEQLQGAEVPSDPEELGEFIRRNINNHFVQNAATELRREVDRGGMAGAVLRGLGTASQEGGARLVGALAASADFLSGNAERAQERVAAIAALEARRSDGGFGVESTELEYLRAFYGNAAAEAASESTYLRVLAASGEFVGDPLLVAGFASKGVKGIQGLRRVLGEAAEAGVERGIKLGASVQGVEKFAEGAGRFSVKDERLWTSIRRAFVRQHGSRESDLMHVFLDRKASFKWIPEAYKNAGWNVLEMPHTSTWPKWMQSLVGGTLRGPKGGEVVNINRWIELVSRNPASYSASERALAQSLKWGVRGLVVTPAGIAATIPGAYVYAEIRDGD